MCVNTREHGCGRPARKPRGAQGRSVSCARTPCVRSAVSGPRLAGTRGARLTHLTPRLPPGAAQRGGGPERAGRAAAAARGAAAGPAHSQRGAARRQHRPVRALLAPCCMAAGTAEPGRVVAAPAWPLPRDKRLRAAAERSLVPQSAPGALRQRLVSASACGRGARRRRIEFETDMFVGCVVIWVAGLPSAPPGLFKGQRRRTSIAVQAPSRAPPAPPLYKIFAEHK